MPTYDYRCTQCKKTFEVFHSITAAPLKKCQKCGGKLERLIGAGAGIIFKGSGFYATDYKKKPAPAAEKKPAVCEPSPKESSQCAKPSCGASD